MISETHFASAYTAFWDQLLPMGARLVRHINLSRERWCEPMMSSVPADRRALVNEAGFRLLRARSRNGHILAQNEVSPDEELGICESARVFLEGLRRTSSGPLLGLTGEELQEAKQLAQRLSDYIDVCESGHPVLVSPSFQGCGILQACSADLFVEPTLYEIKAGDRDFRLVDVRQLLVYCALGLYSDSLRIIDVGLLNPRLGVYFRLDLDSLVRAASGRSVVETTNDIIEFLSRDAGSH